MSGHSLKCVRCGGVLQWIPPFPDYPYSQMACPACEPEFFPENDEAVA